MDGLFEHVACCIDDSPVSRRCLAEARRVAGSTGRLSVVHVAEMPVVYPDPAGAVVPDPQSVAADARAWLEEETRSYPGAELVLLDGHPGSAVCEWAASALPDLIVAGAHRGVVHRILLGGFATYLAHHSPVNVLLVRPERAADA